MYLHLRSFFFFYKKISNTSVYDWFNGLVDFQPQPLFVPTNRKVFTLTNRQDIYNGYSIAPSCYSEKSADFQSGCFDISISAFLTYRTLCSVLFSDSILRNMNIVGKYKNSSLAYSLSSDWQMWYQNYSLHKRDDDNME